MQKKIGLAIVIVTLCILYSDKVRASIVYTYDQLGRVTTAVYDNGLCIAYSYDANGNRTAQSNTLSGGSSGNPAWGSGTWGCFNWTPQ